jgi:hypothetical protein
MIPIALALFLFFDLIFASSFNPNCTLPQEGTNYVNGPNVRGTFDILWNCLSIFLICSWNILHLNVPAERPRPRNFVQKIWWAILDSRAKVKWMLFTILMPEFLVGKALNDWMAAKATSIDMAEFVAGDGVEWKRVHCYFCNMGGFVVDFSPLTSLLLNEGPEKQSASEALASGLAVPANKESTVASKAVLSQSSLRSTVRTTESICDRLVQLVDNVLTDTERKVSRTQEVNLSRMKHKLWALDGCQLSYARSKGIIAALPNVSATYLETLNKGDALVKFLAVIQVSWLIIQLIARKIAGLPSSQLEIATLAFSASSLITYLLFWNRPQGVETVTTIPAARFPSTDDLLYLSRNGPRYLWTGRRTQGKIRDDMDLIPIPNDAFPDIWNIIPYSNESQIYNATGGNEEVLSLAFGAIFGGTIFGGLHCLAWKLHFPTQTEKIIWRACSIILSVLPIISIPPVVLWARYNGIEQDLISVAPWRRYVVASILIVFVVIPYLLARLFIMIEIFRTLFFLPSEAFIETWSGVFPSWG